MAKSHICVTDLLKSEQRAALRSEKLCSDYDEIRQMGNKILKATRSADKEKRQNFKRFFFKIAHQT